MFTECMRLLALQYLNSISRSEVTLNDCVIIVHDRHALEKVKSIDCMKHSSE